jgi:hypothetical protein
MLPPEPEPHSLLGASDPGGVMVRTHDYQPFLAWKKATIKTPVADKFIDLMHHEIGKPFDDEAMRMVLSDKPRDWREPDKWFCSELCVDCLDRAGFFNYKFWTAKNRITPADLLLILMPWIDPDEWNAPENNPISQGKKHEI